MESSVCFAAPAINAASLQNGQSNPPKGWKHNTIVRPSNSFRDTRRVSSVIELRIPIK
jgi:hypothetical protein